MLRRPLRRGETKRPRRVAPADEGSARIRSTRRARRRRGGGILDARRRRRGEERGRGRGRTRRARRRRGRRGRRGAGLVPPRVLDPSVRDAVAPRPGRRGRLGRARGRRGAARRGAAGARGGDGGGGGARMERVHRVRPGTGRGVREARVPGVERAAVGGEERGERVGSGVVQRGDVRARTDALRGRTTGTGGARDGSAADDDDGRIGFRESRHASGARDDGA